MSPPDDQDEGPSSAEREFARMKAAPGAEEAIAAMRALQKHTPAPLRPAVESEKAVHAVVQVQPGKLPAPPRDTIQDLNPLAGKWKPDEGNDPGPINVGGQTKILGTPPPVGAVTLEAASPNDTTQLTPRKQDQRRQRGLFAVLAAVGIAVVIGAAAFVGGDDGKQSVPADAGVEATSSLATASVTAPVPATSGPATSEPMTAPSAIHELPSSPKPSATAERSAAASSKPAVPPTKPAKSSDVNPGGKTPLYEKRD